MMKKYIIIVLVIVALLTGAGYMIFFSSNKGTDNKTQTSNQTTTPMINITSDAFGEGDMIPSKYSCDGQGVNPEISINGVPKNTQSLALIVDDPDAPIGTFTHWILFNIKPNTTQIKENSVPDGALQGVNGFGGPSYGALCPPSGSHRYFFKIYALDTMLNLPVAAERSDVERAMQRHIIDANQLMGVYQRP